MLFAPILFMLLKIVRSNMSIPARKRIKMRISQLNDLFSPKTHTFLVISILVLSNANQSLANQNISVLR